MEAPVMVTETQQSAEVPLTQDAFQVIAANANKGDSKALAELHDLLDKNPQLWHTTGDLAAHAELTLIRKICGGDQLMIESVRRRAEQLRQDLGWATAGAQERLAIDRVVACSLHMQHRDAEAIRAAGCLESLLYATKQQDAAHRRFESAMKLLLLVTNRTSAATGELKPRRPANSAVDTPLAPETPLIGAVA